MLNFTGFRAQAQDEASPALSLDGLLIRNKSAVFFAVMQGNAMLRSGIRHNDLLVIEAKEHYRAGTIVCAFVDHEAIIRRLERTATGYELVPANPKHETKQVDDACNIRGQVIAHVRLLAVPRVPLPTAS